MKTSWAVFFAVFFAFFQVMTSSVWPLAIPQFGLCYVIIASMYLDYSRLLWLSLLVGLILDLFAASGNFGLNMAYLLIVAIITKLFLRPEDQTMRLNYVLLLIVLFGFIYNLVTIAAIARFNLVIDLPTLIKKISLQIMYNIAIGVMMFGLFEYVSSHKRIFKLGKR